MDQPTLTLLFSPRFQQALDREITQLDQIVNRAFAYRERMEFWRIRQPKAISEHEQ